MSHCSPLGFTLTTKLIPSPCLTFWCVKRGFYIVKDTCSSTSLDSWGEGADLTNCAKECGQARRKWGEQQFSSPQPKLCSNHVTPQPRRLGGSGANEPIWPEETLRTQRSELSAPERPGRQSRDWAVEKCLRKAPPLFQ